jgi:hypothetical protein
MKINYEPVEYISDNGHVWHCQHAQMSAEVEEQFDQYREHVSGEVQPMHLEYVEVCDECGHVERLEKYDE